MLPVAEDLGKCKPFLTLKQVFMHFFQMLILFPLIQNINDVMQPLILTILISIELAHALDSCALPICIRNEMTAKILDADLKESKFCRLWK